MGILRVHARCIVILAVEHMSLSFAFSRSQLAGTVRGDFTHCLEYSATIHSLGKARSNLDRITSLAGDILSIDASLHVFQYC